MLSRVVDGEMPGLVGWEDGADLRQGECEINSQGLCWGCKENREGVRGMGMTWLHTWTQTPTLGYHITSRVQINQIQKECPHGAPMRMQTRL